MSVYIKNDSGAEAVWGGQTIADGTYFETSEIDLNLLIRDASFTDAITAGDAVVATANDGSEDLSPADGLVQVMSNGVPAGTYGSSYAMAVLTTDDRGRLTAMDEATVALSNLMTVVASTGDTTTTSSTDSLLSSMIVTPASGDYLVIFNTSMTSNSAGNAISVSIYLGGSQLAATLRKISPFDGGALSATSARASVVISTKVTVNGSQDVEVRWSMSGGTATCHSRALLLIKV